MTMTHVLFAGGRIGYEALNMLRHLVHIGQVFLEREHAHESLRYSERIQALCEEEGIPVSDDLREEAVLSLCREIRPHYLMCFGYRRMIRQSVLSCAKIASVGSHFSPLPRYRGFAPLNWVLINGERETAVNVFFLADEVDAGDIIARSMIPISDQDDINSLTEKCVAALPDVLKRAVVQLETGQPQGEKQDDSLATYTCSRNPEDGLIDWKASSKAIYNLVRALTYPWPGAYTYYRGRRIYIWRCEIVDEKPYEGRVCGKVISISERGFKVLTGDGSVLVTEYSTDPHDTQVREITVTSIRETLGSREERRA